jgi:hypothetical protein
MIAACLLIGCLIEQGGADWLDRGNVSKQGGIVIDLSSELFRGEIVCYNTGHNKSCSFKNIVFLLNQIGCRLC